MARIARELLDLTKLACYNGRVGLDRSVAMEAGSGASRWGSQIAATEQNSEKGWVWTLLPYFSVPVETTEQIDKDMEIDQESSDPP